MLADLVSRSCSFVRACETALTRLACLPARRCSGSPSRESASVAAVALPGLALLPLMLGGRARSRARAQLAVPRRSSVVSPGVLGATLLAPARPPWAIARRQGAPERGVRVATGSNGAAQSPGKPSSPYEPAPTVPRSRLIARDHIQSCRLCDRACCRIGPLVGERLGGLGRSPLLPRHPAPGCGHLRRREPTADDDEDKARGPHCGSLVAAALALGLLTGIVLFMFHMGALHPRYVEGLVPPVRRLSGSRGLCVARARCRCARGPGDHAGPSRPSSPSACCTDAARVVGPPLLAALSRSAWRRDPPSVRRAADAEAFSLAPGAVLRATLCSGWRPACAPTSRRSRTCDAKPSLSARFRCRLDSISSYPCARTMTARAMRWRRVGDADRRAARQDVRPVVILTSYAAPFTSLTKLKRPDRRRRVRSTSFLNSPCPPGVAAKTRLLATRSDPRARAGVCAPRPATRNKACFSRIEVVQGGGPAPFAGKLCAHARAAGGSRSTRISREVAHMTLLLPDPLALPLDYRNASSSRPLAA